MAGHAKAAVVRLATNHQRACHGRAFRPGRGQPGMGWRSWLKRRGSHDRIRWGNDSFLGREWKEYFRTLTPDRRRAAALAVCREALAAVSLHGEGVGQALAALELGR